MTGVGLLAVGFLLGANLIGTCSSMPENVSNLLKNNPGWSMTQEVDLSADDKELWQSHHSHKCPGMTKVTFMPADTYYAALLYKPVAGGKYRQRLFACPQNNNYAECKIITALSDGLHYVIWSAGPGNYKNKETGKNVRIIGESLIFEKMESVSIQYYMSRGKIKNLLASE